MWQKGFLYRKFWVLLLGWFGSQVLLLSSNVVLVIVLPMYSGERNHLDLWVVISQMSTIGVGQWQMHLSTSSSAQGYPGAPLKLVIKWYSLQIDMKNDISFKSGALLHWLRLLHDFAQGIFSYHHRLAVIIIITEKSQHCTSPFREQIIVFSDWRIIISKYT